MSLATEEIYRAAIERLDDTYDLYYAEYGDRLTDEQIEDVVSGRADDFYIDLPEAITEARHLAAVMETSGVVADAIEALMPGGDAWDRELTFMDFECTQWFDEVRSEVENRSVDDPLRELAGYTPEPLVQHAPVDPIEIRIDSVIGWHRQAVVEALEDLGLEATSENIGRLDDALANCHDFANIRPIFTVDLSELLDPSVEFVRLTNPILLCLNAFDGSGMDTAPMDGTIEFPRDQIVLDSALGHASWDEIAGVVPSAYTVPTEYVRPTTSGEED